MAFPKLREVDFLADFLNQEIEKQSWFRANSNTITSAVGFVSTLLVWLGTQPFATDERVQAGIFIVGFLLTVFGVKHTKNGWSASQINKINEYGAELRAEVSDDQLSPVIDNRAGRY
jgi:hypothetical protein|nr:MAG TPA: hypothetical protein [Caudoviricetes sp.]